MGAGQIIVGEGGKSEVRRVDQKIGWGGVQVLAGLLVAAGAIDIAAAFYPSRFADPGWVFGIMSGVITGTALLSLGMLGGLVAAIAVESARGVRVFGVLNLLLAVLILVALVLFLSKRGAVVEMTSVENLPNIRKAVFRTSVAGVVFPVTHLYAFLTSRRAV